MSKSFSLNTANHEEKILSLLQSNKGRWVTGSDLFSASETSAMPARICSLRAQGWIITSRPGNDDQGFYDYRLDGKQAPPGRKKLLVQLPSNPQKRAYTAEEVKELQEAVEAQLALLVQERFPAIEDYYYEQEPEIDEVRKKEVDDILAYICG